jgi:hypothetical protein
MDRKLVHKIIVVLFLCCVPTLACYEGKWDVTTCSKVVVQRPKS